MFMPSSLFFVVLLGGFLLNCTPHPPSFEIADECNFTLLDSFLRPFIPQTVVLKNQSKGTGGSWCRAAL
jgi:hypothetical protein